MPQAGSRTLDRRPREKTFADIPAEDRALYQKHFARTFASRLKPEEAEKRYADKYWANKGS